MVAQVLRTDNEAVLVSRLFRLGLWLLGISQLRIQPGCPWQNGRVERFIGTVKRELATEPMTDRAHVARTLKDIRIWYNHERPHDHLQGRTPAEVWARAREAGTVTRISCPDLDASRTTNDAPVRRGVSSRSAVRVFRTKNQADSRRNGERIMK